MKICMLTDAWTPWWGGGQTHVWEISQKLVSEHGCVVDIIVPNLTDKNHKIFPKVEEYHGGKLKVLRLGALFIFDREYPGREPGGEAGEKQLRKAVSRETTGVSPWSFIFPNLLGRILFVKDCVIYSFTNKYDLYHSHSYFTSLFLLLIKFFKRGKIVFTLHGMGTSMLGAGFINKLGILEILNKFVVYGIKYDALITVAKKSLTQKTNTNVVTVIGNGVNLEKYDEINVKKKEDTFNLLWVGRMVPVKGLSLLVSVFGKLVLEYSKLRLKLIGDGPERSNLELQIKQLKLQDKVAFTGSLGKENELIKEYKSSSAFILPSLSAEGFPVTIVEAMAAKLPVIASDIGDTDLLVQNGRTGYLVRPGDSQDLLEKVTKLIDDTRRAEMGKRGYNLVRRNYTWDLITQQVHEVYSKVLKS